MAGRANHYMYSKPSLQGHFNIHGKVSLDDRFINMGKIGHRSDRMICILYGFPCEMDFSHHKSLATRVGYRDEWWEIHRTWKTIQKKYFIVYFTFQGDLIMPNTLRIIEYHENHVRWIYLTTVLNMGEVRSMWEALLSLECPLKTGLHQRYLNPAFQYLWTIYMYTYKWCPSFAFSWHFHLKIIYYAIPFINVCMKGTLRLIGRSIVTGFTALWISVGKIKGFLGQGDSNIKQYQILYIHFKIRRCQSKVNEVWFE